MQKAIDRSAELRKLIDSGVLDAEDLSKATSLFDDLQSAINFTP